MYFFKKNDKGDNIKIFKYTIKKEKRIIRLNWNL